MKSLIIVFVLLLAGVTLPQINPGKVSQEDVFTELEEGVQVVNFFDALTGKPIEGAKVVIDGAIETTTNFEGKAKFEVPLEKENANLEVKFTHPKYVDATFKIEVMGGTLWFNRFSVSPKMPLGTIRIVLDWDAKPSDLDAHLVKKESYHISYRDKKVSDDRVAVLDKDDTDGYGPETITVSSTDLSAEYVYYVHDYTNQRKTGSTELSRSKACVKVYDAKQGLVQMYYITEDVIGDKWPVFKIVRGEILPGN